MINNTSKQGIIQYAFSHDVASGSNIAFAIKSINHKGVQI